MMIPSIRKLIPGYFIFAIIFFATACQSAEKLKTEQYFAEGYQLYTNNCANCHQADGSGMANLYPSLPLSPALKDKAALSCIIKNGMKDTISVNGKDFHRPMPPNPKLTDLEIAEIITYVGMKWQKDSIYTSIQSVNASLQLCKEL